MNLQSFPPLIPALNGIGLPEVVKTVPDNHQCLILVTGATGHGKATPFAAMIDYINENRPLHIGHMVIFNL